MLLLFLVILYGSLPNLVNAVRASCIRPDSNGETVTFPEDTALFTMVYTYFGFDADGDFLIYYSIGAIDPFFVNGKTLQVNSPLDFETNRQHLVNNVFVRDGSTALLFGDRCGPLTVIVLPVNEYTPVFNPSVITISAPEGLPPNFVVFTTNCTDADKEPIGSREGCSQIFIQSGDDVSPRFTMVNEEVVTTNNVIDYDTGDVTYTLIIVGIDSSTRDAKRTGTLTLIINIDPVNEFPPSFQGSPFERNLQENTPVGTVILPIVATDDDATPHGDVTYKITTIDDVFLISLTTGKMYLRRPIDFEVLGSSVYYVTVEATDGGLTSTTVVNVTITDVNDNVPVCTPNEFNVTIDEGLQIGTSVSSIKCSDRDAGSVLTYHILSGDRGHFQTTPSGDILLTNEVDYDSGIFSYYMEIEISDGLHTTKFWVLVQVNPVNEFLPILNNPTVNVSEIAPIGHEVITYKADDGDAPPHDMTSYQLINVQNGNLDTFYLEEPTGKVYLIAPLDYETIPQYKLIIRATDLDGNTATGTVTVNVDNENDHSPSCKQLTGTYMVSENAAVGTVVVADFDCIDLDNNPITYSLVQTPSDGTFEVNAATGQLTVRGPLDYETTSFYSVLIKVSDGSLSTTIKLAINVLNENEGLPKFINDVVTCTISEADPVGTYVATVSASDEENDPLTYSFVGTYPEFLIDPKLGNIKLRRMVDREKMPLVVLLVEASDGLKASTATVSVTIDDVNEKPVFERSKYDYFVEENMPSGTSIGKMSAKDPDDGLTNGEVRYKIVAGNEKGCVSVNAISGVISVSSPIDYETQRTILMVAQVSDLGSPALSSVCTIIIQIIDQNDNAPSFLSVRIKERVPEDAPIGQIVSQVFAIDKDSSKDNNNKVLYESSSVVPFVVEPSSGIVTIAGNLDRELSPRYEMVITATDHGSPQLTGTLTLEIEITDVNDNNPTIRGQYVASVPENVPIHFVVFNIDAYDADGDTYGKLKYEMVSAGMNSIFQIEENTGTVQVASPLDRESTNRYELIIRVSDDGIPPRSTTMTATVYVLDVNDFAPKPDALFYQFSVSENAFSNTKVGNVSVKDNDIGINSELVYDIATYWTGSSVHFSVNQRTGEIYTAGALDREVEDVYSFLLRVKDSGTPLLSSDITININIEDVNDNYPVFTRPLYSTSIFENLTSGSNFLSTGATDNDIGKNARISYELDTSDDNGLRANYYFGVDEDTGNVFLRQRVDREVYQSFSLTIVARDNGVPSLTNQVNVVINVEDVNDNFPDFSPLFYNTEASSVNLCDSVIATVTATDKDLGRNAAINYRLQENDPSLPFSVSQLGVVTAHSDLTQSKYVIHVEAEDNGDPLLTSKEHAKVRIDRFDPDQVVITFHLDAMMPDYLTKEFRLLNHIQETLSMSYPTSYVRRWCVVDKTKVKEVHLYAVKNDETNDARNIYKEKLFLTNGEFLDVLQLDLNKIPTADINGQLWNNYGIIKVTPYGEVLVYRKPTVSGLSDSSKDLTIPLGVSLPLAFLVIIATIVLLCVAWRKRWCRRKEEEIMSERAKTTGKAENIGKNDHSWVSADHDITKTGHGLSVKSEDVLQRKEEVSTRQVKGPFIRTAPSESSGVPSKTRSPPIPMRRGNSQRIGIISPEVTEPADIKRSDGRGTRRGIDIVTGWMYEEDPETKVRNWIRSPQ